MRIIGFLLLLLKLRVECIHERYFINLRAFFTWLEHAGEARCVRRTEGSLMIFWGHMNIYEV